MEEEINIQIENNVSSVECTFRVITYVSWLLGVGILHPPRWPKIVTMILRILHFGVCTVIVVYGAIDFFTFGSVFKSDIFKIMYYMNKVMCYVSAYYYVYHGIRYYEKWPEFIERIEKINQRIRKETSIEDILLKNGQILAMLIVLVLGPVSLMIHSFYYYFTLPQEIFASDLLLYYTIAQSTANSFVFDIIVYTVCRRFKKLNKIIEKIDKRLTSSWFAYKIRRIRELHSSICDLVTFVNDVHGIQLLLCSANSFTMVVATLFRIYMGVVEKNYSFIVINNIIWIIYASQFALICWICTLTCKESKRTGILIHAIILDQKESSVDNTSSISIIGHQNRNQENSSRFELCNNHRRFVIDNYRYNLNYYEMENLLRTNFERDCIRNEINDFSSQLQQFQISFTACDFFEMNNTLLTGFVGAITTYLIILVQFYQPEHLNSQKFNARC